MRRFSALLACLAALGGTALTGSAWAQQAAPAADPLAEAAAAYALWQDDVSWLTRRDIEEPAQLEEALDRAARHPADALTRGWIAYGALTAAQSPAFVAGVRSRVRAANRAAVLRRLNADPAYARNRPPGSGEAIQLMLQSARADAGRLIDAGARARLLGEGLQTVAWANAPQADREARATRLRALAQTTPPAPADLALRLRLAPGAANPLADPNAFGGRNYWNALAGAPVSPPYAAAPVQRATPARTALIDRMLTLAALHVIGATREARARVDALLSDETTQRCLSLQSLQFRQCVSVTQFAYENAYCLARHGLREPGGCLGSLAQ